MTNNDQPPLNPQTSSIRNDHRRRARNSPGRSSSSRSYTYRSKGNSKDGTGPNQAPSSSLLIVLPPIHKSNKQHRRARKSPRSRSPDPIVPGSKSLNVVYRVPPRRPSLVPQHAKDVAASAKLRRACGLDYLLTEDRPDEINDCGMGI